MCDIAETYGIGHLRNIDLLFLQQAHGLFEPDVTDELAHGQTCQFLHLAVELRTADTYLTGKHVNIEIAVRQVGVHSFHDTFHQ